MAQSNTKNQDQVDPTTDMEKSTAEEDREQKIEAIQKSIADLGITISLMVFKFPDDEDGAFRTIRQGHFYDSLQMVSEYCRRAKKRIASDLDGIS